MSVVTVTTGRGIPANFLSSMHRSNHLTGRLPDGRWLKVAGSTSLAHAERIVREGCVLSYLGQQVEHDTVGGLQAIITEHRGESVYEPVPVMLDMICDPAPAPGWLPSAAQCVPEIHADLNLRLSADPDPDASAALRWSRARLDRAEADRLAGNRLQHNDAHLRNWVADEHGPHLIDWEGSTAGDPHLDLATHFYYMLLGGHEVDAIRALDRVRDMDAMRAGWLVKTAKNTSWNCWERNRDGASVASVLTSLRQVIDHGDRLLGLPVTASAA